MLFVEGLIEQTVTCSSRAQWIRAVVRSGNACCKWLRRNIIGKWKMTVVTEGQGVITWKKHGHFARKHVRDWYALLKEHKWKELRGSERVLRHSVQFWRYVFMPNQERLKDEFYIDALRLHPSSLYVTEDLRRDFSGEKEIPVITRCLRCGAEGSKYCSSCMGDVDEFRKDRDTFLSSLCE